MAQGKRLLLGWSNDNLPLVYFCFLIKNHQNFTEEAHAFRRGEESARSDVSFIGKISSLKFLLPLDLHHILYYNLEKGRW